MHQTKGNDVELDFTLKEEIESIDKNQIKVTLNIGNQKFEEGMNFSYNKNKKSFQMQGFRKGHVPRKMIEAAYGAQVFYEDAINHIFPQILDAIVKEHDLKLVSLPQVDLMEVSKENGVDLSFTAFTKPEISVHDYLGVTYQKYDTSVSEREVFSVLERDRDKNARLVTVTDRAVAEKDIVNINFEGFVDGVAFEGGKAEGYEITIGSHTFIDNFEDQLIGHMTDEDVVVNVTFPDEYQQPSLSGKAAEFHVHINEIKFKELPELNDEFAQDVSEFETMDEYTESIKKKLLENKEKNAEANKENQIIANIIERNPFELPEVMIENRVHRMIDETRRNMRYSGYDLETYLKYMGRTIDDMKLEYHDDAENFVRGQLVIEAILKQEKENKNEYLNIPQERIDEELNKIAEAYKITKEDVKNRLGVTEEGITEELQYRETIKYLLDNAIEME